MRKYQSHHSRYTRRGTKVRFAILAAVVVVLLVGGYIAGRWLEERQYHEERQQMSENFGLLPTREYNGQTYMRRPEVETILLMGVDRHMEEEVKSYQNGGQADFLLFLALDHQNRTIHQLQIDRDTMTDVTVYSLLGDVKRDRVLQICLAHGFGGTDEERCKNAVQAVEKLLGGIDVELYMSVKLDGIAALNQALGGITVTLPEDYSNLDPVMVKGATLKLTDKQAEYLVRARMTVGDGTNASRMMRQRTFMNAAANQLLVKLKEDAEFGGTLFDALDQISCYMNFNRGRMINEINRAYQYDIRPAETVAGEYKIGENGYMEFYPDKDAVSEWVISNLFELKK